MPKLVLLRHGQSQWNLENRFTGWVDVDLTAEGEAQAKRGGELMKKAGLHIDQAFTSVLTRAIRTCQLALQSMGESDVPVTKDWRLNERHYGGLTGLNKAETAEKHGEEQVKIWRRSYDVPPPPLGADSPYDFANDPRYEGAVLPNTESLKTTLERVLPFWTASIVPVLRRGDTVLIAAHGNSIRAIIKSLFDLSDEAILDVEVPTGNPLVIQLSGDLKPLQAEYLDAERANPLPEVA